VAGHVDTKFLERESHLLKPEHFEAPRDGRGSDAAESVEHRAAPVEG
jgi:hypothetical protein